MYVCIYIYIYIYICESTERAHKRRAFGENVVRICCRSSTCDVTKTKKIRKKCRSKERVRCFIRVVVPKIHTSGTKRVKNLGAFKSRSRVVLFLPFVTVE